MAEEVCKTCNGTGVEDTGNNDFPCHCPLGKTTVFNVSTSSGLKQMTGAELDAYNAAGQPEGDEP